MRVVVQRVLESNVKVDGTMISSIEKGFNCLVGIKNTDTFEDLTYIKDKILKLRIFEDEEGKLNKSITDINGEILLISQFTLYGDVRKGTRPSFINSMKRDLAVEMFNEFVDMVKNSCDLKVAVGCFGCNMQVNIVNDGPVTILIDSNKDF